MKDRKNQARGLAKVSDLFLSGPESPREKVTIQVAAKTLDVSKGTIITYLNNGLLTRIKEGDFVYIPMDEVRALRDSMKKLDVITSIDTSSERGGRRDTVTVEKDHHKRLLAHFGQPENERQYLFEHKAALEAKDKELKSLKSGFNTLKRNLETQASELERTKAKLRELQEEQQKRLVESKSTANANNQDLLEKIQARLLMVEEELKRLRRPSWKELFGHLRLRPERSRKKGVVLFGTLALLAVLIFSVCWFNRSPKQPPSPVTEGQASGSGTVLAAPQAVLDSELQQEQSARVVQQPSELLQTTVAPEPEPAALNAQTPQPYSSRVEGSPSSEERVSPLPEADQQIVGLSSTPPPHVLRAETLATTWLHVVIDERQELEYLLHPNEKHTWRAMSGFRLHIGNAAGLKLFLNDQPLKPVGESGEVVHLQLPDPSLIVTSNSGYTEPVSRP
jgi:hypothetical protein